MCFGDSTFRSGAPSAPALLLLLDCPLLKTLTIGIGDLSISASEKPLLSLLLEEATCICGDVAPDRLPLALPGRCCCDGGGDWPLNNDVTARPLLLFEDASMLLPPELALLFSCELLFKESDKKAGKADSENAFRCLSFRPSEPSAEPVESTIYQTANT